jgi:hypothetical protein
MRVRSHLIGVAVLAVSAAGPAPASAQTGDPEAGSPSGVIYEIPLDNARRDAAPTRGGDGKGGGTSGSGGGTTSGSGSGSGVTTANGTVSPIHSENGFGSSSTVPGVAAAVAAKLGGKSNGKKAGSRKSPGSTKTPVVGPPVEGLGPPKSATVSATPSKSRAYLLLVLALAVAAGIGVAGRYVARRR